MPETIVVGLTGPTGAGKTVAGAFLQKAGCHVIDCDRVAKEVAHREKACVQALSAAFGADIVDENGELRRGELARRAFASRESTALLNRITHPFITKQIEKEIARAREVARVIVLDAPTLFESGANRMCDAVLVVVAPEAIRRQRILERDGLSSADAKLRMQSQQPERYYTERADYVIDGTLPLAGVEEELARFMTKLTGEIN